MKRSLFNSIAFAMKALAVIVVCWYLGTAILEIKRLGERIEYNSVKTGMQTSQLDGLIRSLINNRIIGDQNGYKIFDGEPVPPFINFEKMEKDIDNLQDHLLSFIIMKWLFLETRGEFGTARQKKALDLSVKEMNLMLKELIPDPAKRSDWIQAMREMLPKKNKPATTTDK